MARAELSSLLDDFFHLMEAESRVAAIDEYLAPDATVLMNGQRLSVPDYRKRLHKQDRRLDVTNVEILNRITDGNEVAVSLQSEYRQTDTAYGVEPSGRTISATLSSFHEFDGDQMVHLEVVYDGSQTLRELGLLSENPVTEKLRDQYYEVLNRVLRHNLRNDMNVIRSTADLLRRNPEMNPGAIADEIDHTTDSLLATVDKARSLERLAIDNPLSIETVDMTAVADRLGRRYEHTDSLTCHCDHEPIAVDTDRRLVENMLGEAIENAIEHNTATDPEVRLDVRSATGERYAVELVVSDNGPGIPDTELRPLRQDEETELLHGSGIGLWILKWCTTRLEGDVTFDTADGTAVVIRLPDLN